MNEQEEQEVYYCIACGEPVQSTEFSCEWCGFDPYGGA